jgi:hypothetical protein
MLPTAYTDKNQQIDTKTEVSANANNNKPWLFQKGVSGNPSGKPKGSRNKATILLESITEEKLEKVIHALVEKATWGNTKCIEILINKLVPAPKPHNTQLIEDDDEVTGLKLDTPEDIKRASEMIIKAMIAGKISAGEANDMMGMIERYGKL